MILLTGIPEDQKEAIIPLEHEGKRLISKAFGLCILVYIVALGTAIGVGFAISNTVNLIVMTFVADVAATLVIYVFSCIFVNASFYDPYWSVAPIAIALYWMITSESTPLITVRQIIVFTLVLFWGLRLTYNWARQWRGLSHEDWRYANYRKNNPRFFWWINLVGIELMPTTFVFLGCLSLYPALSFGSNSFGFLDVVGIVVTLSAIIIEIIADEQLREFLKSEKKQKRTMSSGVWAYTRHPNYFGEISFWWGLYFFSLASDLNYWWTIIGPIAITVLFIFISIPMMEKHLSKRRSDYAEYQQKVSKLIPWFPKK